MLDFRYAPKPQEASPGVVERLVERDHLAQSKYNGWRLWAQVGWNEVRCLTASGNPMDRQPQAKFDLRITDQLKTLRLPPDTVLDAEYVGPRGNHAPAVYVFDMLAWDGRWIAQHPYEERWQHYCGLSLPACGIIHLAHTVANDFLGLFYRLKSA